MALSSNVTAMIHRVGKPVTILERSVVGTDEFHNPEHEWTDNSEPDDPPIKAVRTYKNRNKQNDSPGGPRAEDHPVFMFTLDAAPDAGARVAYGSQTYELGSATHYDTHVEFLAKHVTG